jgi:penicillin amidase
LTYWNKNFSWKSFEGEYSRRSDLKKGERKCVYFKNEIPTYSMKSRIIKIVIGIGIALFLIALGGAVAVNYLVKRSIPNYESKKHLQGLSAPVQIFYDEFKAAHIIAETKRDLFFAQGYTHARERLWQMELQRRAANGRLAEILGEGAIGFDKLFRTVGINRLSKALWAWEGLSPESREAISAYCDGVNAFLDEVRRKDSSLPIEFDVLGYEPELWSPEDCLAIVRLMGWELNIAWHIDVALAEIEAKVGKAKAMQLHPDYPKGKPIIVSAQASAQAIQSLTAFRESDSEFRAAFGSLGSHIGSNAWAVTRSKSTTGKAILANDPHLGFMTPSRWYEVHLVCKSENLNAAGCSLPGTPALVLGKTDNLAWGLTNVMADDCDFFLTRDTTFTEIIEEIKVKNADPMPLLVRLYNKHGVSGVVISEDVRRSFQNLRTTLLPTLAREKKFVVMQWTGFEKSDELKAMLGVLRATNWNDFRNALRHFGVPGQNFLYADTDGNIGYQPAAKIPIRLDKQGFVLRNADDSLQAWRGFIPFDSLPRLFNPPSDFIVNANNKLVGDDYPYYISALWEPPSRAERITELILSKEKLSPSEIQAMQFDVVSPMARDLMPFLMNAIASDTTQKHERAIQYLKNWRYDFSEKEIAPTIFAQFLKQLLRNTFHDELGDDAYQNYLALINSPTRTIQRLLADSTLKLVQRDSVLVEEVEFSDWFDDVRTPDVKETRDDIIRKSFAEAIDILSEKISPDDANWQWGKWHTLTVRHLFGQKSNDGVAKFFNFETVPSIGTATTINNGEYYFRQADPDGKALVNVEHKVGASSRRVIDLSNPNEFRSILPGGNSGEPASPHYNDQLPLWRKGELRTFLTNLDEVQRRNFPKTELLPK